MKKAKSGGRSSAPNRKGAPKNVSACVARVPEPARGTLNKLRAAVRSVVPREATETISYGIPTFRHGRPTLVDTGTVTVDKGNLKVYREALAEYPKPL
jgi:uncharacterized protein YdhG (YjbR/CyaY superfamily)